MPGARRNFIGLEGFIWWVGIVEDRQDPEKLGRVRVRCFGWHTDDKTRIPTETLPWAHPVLPVNNPAAYTPKEGDMVFGFFIDGENAQNPAIVGVLPGIPEKKPDYNKGFADPRKNLSGAPKKPDDANETYPKSKYLKEPTTSRLARGKQEGTIVATRKKNLKKNIRSAGGMTWSEPPPAYAAKYPYNYAHETESGHVLELDDTPGAERVQLGHRSGSVIEIDKNGNRVDKITKDSYTVILGNGYISISGKAAITVDGDFNLKTSKINIEATEINMASSGSVKIKGSDVKIESTGGMDLKSGGTAKFTSGGKMNIKGSTAAVQGATVDIAGAAVNLQSGSAASADGTGLSVSAGAAAAPSRVIGLSGATATAISSLSGGGSLGAAVAGVAGSVDAAADLGAAIGSVSGNLGPIGKVVDGLTNSIQNVVGVVNGVADGLIQDFNSLLPIGELTTNVNFFEGLVENTKGSILSLPQDLKSGIVQKIGDIATRSSELSIDFSVDSLIQNEIDNLSGNGAAVRKNILAKHIYPKTETIPVANTSGE